MQRRWTVLSLLLAGACGDSSAGTSQSASDSDSSVGTSTTTGDAATASTEEVPTTGSEGSHSASESETGGATATATATETATTDDTTAGVSESGTTETTSGGCVDECMDGALQCVGADAVQACEVGEAGCLVWGAPDECAAGSTCEDGECVAGCSDACTLGDTQCAADGVADCVDDPMSGCTVWSEAVACDAGEACVEGVCTGPAIDCTDDCVWTKQAVNANIDLYGVWGSSAQSVWTVGKAGSALYYNGNTWKAVDTGILTRLDCVDGSAADDVYAISSDGKIIRWDGSEWTFLSNLFPDLGKAGCLSVIGPGDLLAITYGTGGYDVDLWRVQDGVKTLIWEWSDEVLPPIGVKEVSVSFRAFSPTSALATSGHVWRWDGVKSTDLQSPNHSYGLWAPAPDLLYAAARNVGLGGRWDGQMWKVVNPALDGYLHMFTGSSAARIFGVGEQKADSAAAIVAFDGIGWSPAAVPADANSLFAAWTAPTGEVFAVGKGGTILIGK
ncbi:hypothetical protein [Nannocystis sp. SCPEA4]|uniref:hypothetical protein n=1 Tax=Nannocystis sp. SCPEA4 TaxID=2996787 RepID=UPI00226E1FC8|nr:hypothetical protein [Nannocystis sp. SCPEA4]MCY1054857.1 hypothetical protein [Nannocystis sp. SCPEA4]